MERMVELAVSLPGLRATRVVSASLETGVKEHHGVGRIEHGRTQWWGAGKIWRSEPGCLLVKRRGDVVRHLAHDGPTTFTAVVFPAKDVARVCDEARLVPVAQLERGDARGAPFHRLIDAVSSGAERFSLEVVLAEAIDALTGISSAPDQSRPVRRAMEYLHERLGDSITLADLADFAGLDKFHLCRAFRAQVGMPPHAYLTHLRIARAKQLLGGGMRASEVAPLVGFCDQSQLTRHFHKLVGTTPARYARAAG